MITETSASSVRPFVRHTQFKALIAGAIVGLALFFLKYHSAGLGLIGGTILSILNFQLMWADIIGMGLKTSVKAKWFIAGRYILRYGIVFGFLAVMVLRLNLNIIALIIGLFSIQIIIAAEHIIMPAFFFRKNEQ
jgi:hypothetical protein